MGWAAAVLASTLASSSTIESPCQASPSKARRIWSARRTVSDMQILSFSRENGALPSIQILKCRCNDGDSRRIRRAENLSTIEQQTFSRIQRQTTRSCFPHYLNRFYADDWDVKPHILIRLRRLDHRQRPTQRRRVCFQRSHDLPGALDGRVR